jgi:hypothetical protein
MLLDRSLTSNMHRVRSLVLLAVASGCLSLSHFVEAQNPIPRAQDTSGMMQGRCINVDARKRAVDLWRGQIRASLRTNLIEAQVLREKNTFALYNLQAFLQNFVTMMRRCEEWELLDEVIDVLRPSFGALEREPGGERRMWVCRGGPVCNETNRFINREIPLNSLQFVALLSAVVGSIAAVPSASRSSVMVGFVNDASEVIWNDHVGRHASISALASFGNRTNMDVARVPKAGTSAHFLHDTDLWLLAAIAEFVPAIQELDQAKWQAIRAGPEYQRVRQAFSEGLTFVRKRITFDETSGQSGPRLRLGDIDRGMWRYYKDNRYAGYVGEAKPIACDPVRDAAGNIKGYAKRILVKAEGVPIVETGGWDFSHARRLVHFFHALDRNRNAIRRHLDPEIDAKLPPDTAKAFANSVLVRIWNGDERYPMFANYFDGTRGWYRVDHDVGTGGCREGYPPFGLSEAFATGGYVFWSDYEPRLGTLGSRLEKLFQSKAKEDADFVAARYENFSANTSASNRALHLFQFLPSLVGVRQ